MKNYLLKASIVSFLFILFTGHAVAQQNQKQPFSFEARARILGGFGPSESQAEIAGGFDSLSYDNMKHLIPGFKQSNGVELAAGYQKNRIRVQSTIAYFQQDIKLIQRVSSNEYPFVSLEMLSAKASVLLQLSNPEKCGSDGFYDGLSLGLVSPISHDLNDLTKAAFNFNDFRPSAQFFWSMDYSYSFQIAKGFYFNVGASVTMPGLVGCVGRMEMLPNSDYTITRDKVKMYSVSGFLGFGYRLVY